LAQVQGQVAAAGAGDPGGDIDQVGDSESGAVEHKGSYEIRNVWPGNYRGFLNADDKDRLENYLHDAVCSGQMRLQAAQEAIAADWVKAYCAARLGECPAGLR
jgi:hypothetical protein